MSAIDDIAAALNALDAASGWDRDDNKPAIPKIPRPRPPQDSRVDCEGCGDDRPRREIRDRAGYALCPDCQADSGQRAARELNQLAYTLAASTLILRHTLASTIRAIAWTIQTLTTAILWLLTTATTHLTKPPAYTTAA